MSDLVDMSMINAQWLPGLFRKGSMHTHSTSISDDLYLPSVGMELFICIYG